MNLTKTPTKAQLKEVLASADDSQGHHVLWVDMDGEVHLDLLPEGGIAELLESWGYSPQPDLIRLSEVKMEDPQNIRMRFYFEIFACDNDYVGVEASKDDAFVNRIFTSLIDNWNKKPGGSRFIDNF